MFRSLKLAFLPILALFALASPAHAQLYIVRQNTAYTIALPDIIAASDHISGLAAQTGTVYLTRVTGTSGAITKAASTNNISEIDNVNAPGQYNLALTATELGALGYIKGYYKSASSDPMSFMIKVIAYDPDDGAALGLSRLDAAVSSRSTYAGADTAGTTSLLSRLGVPVGASISADIAAVQTTSTSNSTSLGTLTTRIPGTVQPQTGDAFARLGSPAGASVSADILSANTALSSHTTSLSTLTSRLGVPLGASISADLGGVAASVWGVGTRTLTAFAFTPNVLNITGTVPAVTLAAGQNVATLGGLAPPVNFNLLSIDSAGKVALTTAEHALIQTDAATGVLSAVVDGGFTFRQMQALSTAVLSGNFTVTRNSGAKTITVVYYRPADPGNTTLAFATLVTNYSDTALTIPTTRTVTFTNKP